MKKLKSFVSIEYECPNWKDARKTILTAIPDHLTFKLERTNVLSIDFDWAYNLLKMCPEEYVNSLKNRFLIMNDQINLTNLGDRLKECFITGNNKIEATVDAVHYANNLVRSYDETMRASCKPTIKMRIEYSLGVLI